MAFAGPDERPEFAVAEADQTPEEKAAAERRRRVVAAAAGGALAVGAGDDASAAGKIPAAAARVTALGAILSALVAFLAVQRSRMRTWLKGQLGKRAPAAGPDDIERVIAEEEERGAEFEKRSAARFARDLTAALAIPDPAARDRAVRGITSREKRYARQRDEAMAARALAAIDRVVLRQQSPQGAFWKLDPTVVEHTAGCLVMGGKFWPWAVLDRIHPPRHAGCPCRLAGYGEAVADGLMSPGDVMDVATAVRLAAHVVMEGAVPDVPEADAEALIEAAGGRELLALRGALLDRGMITERDFDRLEPLAEFDPDQPRYPKGHPKAGQWRPKLGSGWGDKPAKGKRADKLAARKRADLDELRTLVAGERVGTDDRSGEAIIHRAQSPGELAFVGAKAWELAERYGTHSTYRARIDALHVERVKISDAHWERLTAAGGVRKLYDEATKADPDTTIEDVKAPYWRPGERERIREIDAEVQKLIVSEDRAKRDAVLGVLAEIRPMGGKLKRGEFTGTDDERGTFEKSLREAEKLMPKAWAEDVNSKGVVHYGITKGRAWHLPDDTSNPTEEAFLDEKIAAGWKFVGYTKRGGRMAVVRDTDGNHHVVLGEQSWPLGSLENVTLGRRVKPGWNSTIEVRAADPSTLLHEQLHRIEQVYGDVHRMTGTRPIFGATYAFLTRRAQGEALKKLADLRPGSGYTNDEVTYEDEFVDPYIGKRYRHEATEVLTMGAQMLFYPTHGRRFDAPKSGTRGRSDTEMRDFIFGLFAVL